jgi:hypothetical protein
MTNREKQRQERRTARLEFPGTGVSIPFPEEDDPAAEARALNEAYEADPAFRAMVDDLRRDRAAGRGIPAEELYQELGYTPLGRPARAARTGARSNGRHSKPRDPAAQPVRPR